MTLAIRSIKNPGEAERERVVLKAESDINVGRYVVLKAEVVGDDLISDGQMSAAYWFPDKDVRQGDLVVLYTKHGSAGEKTFTSGSTSHFFYWGLDRPCWGESAAAVLVQAVTWTSKTLRAPDSDE